MKRCKIEGCENEQRSRGWCNPHYRRWTNYGDPEGGPYALCGSSFTEKADRFITKTDSCWLWTGGTTRDGYGQVHIGGVKKMAYRASYEAFVGPIPKGYDVDHLCYVRECVNPNHLEAVTHRENSRRAFARRAAIDGKDTP